MTNPDALEFYSTVPISVPRVVPEAEDVHMNGFVWSAEFGLMVAFADSGEVTVDALQKLRTPRETYETYDQGIQGNL